MSQREEECQEQSSKSVLAAAAVIQRTEIGQWRWLVGTDMASFLNLSALLRLHLTQPRFLALVRERLCLGGLSWWRRCPLARTLASMLRLALLEICPQMLFQLGDRRKGLVAVVTLERLCEEFLVARLRSIVL